MLKAVPAGYERGYPIANVNVSIDNAAVGLTNQYGAIDVENLAVGTHRLDVALKTFENGADKHYNGGTDIILKKSREQKTFLLVKGEGPAAFAAIEDGKEVFVLNEYDVNEQIVPVVVVAIYGAIVVGGFLWDAYDYWQCAKKAEDWDPEKSVWDNYKCDSISEKDADAFNDCVDKVLSKNQNQADECVFETGMIMLNFVPVENAFKTVGKLGVKLGGKGAKKLITFVPFIDDAFEGSYKVFRAVKGNEVYIKVVHYAKKGAVYTFKVVDNSLKIFDNAVGLIVNKVARNPDTWKIITEKVNAVVFKTTAADIPIGKLNSIQTIQGILGEKAGDEYVTAAKLALEKEGNEVIIEKGLPNAVVERFKDSGKYIVEYTDTGKGIIIFEKTAKGSRGSTIGEIDGLLFVNGKPTVIESKAAIADNIRGSIEPVDFFKSKVHTVEDLTGQKPEVLLLVPKGEAGKLAGELQSFSEHAGKEGVNFAYDEFPETADDFGKAARLILDDDMTKGAKLLSAYVDDLKKLGMPDDMLERVLKNLGRYSDDIIRKYTHTLYEPGQAFVFRGRQPAEFPVKIADGKEVLDWGAIKIGNADVNLARKNLDFIKNLPEKERLQYAKLSLAHVEGSPNIFISTSKIPSLAANDYGKKGYVFIINPRARNALDVEKTIQKQLDKGEILQSHYDLHADVISKESEVAFIEKIDGEDILGAVKVDGVGKVLKDSFENNPFYRSETLAEDIAKGKEMTGG
ncbi:hypothetical protein HYU12_03560 [Candidatus Woesearchaeota archaeon]|nr:hypothetical protein [Candidatus Woesearchaeota archaeon]